VFGDGGALLEGLPEEMANERHLRDIELARLFKEDLDSLDWGFDGDGSLLGVVGAILLWRFGDVEACLSFEFSSASSSQVNVMREE